MGNKNFTGRVKFIRDSPIEPPKLRLFGRIPAGHLAHAVRGDQCVPLLLDGQVAVITDHKAVNPTEGNWYLIEYSKGCDKFSGSEQRTREIIAPILRSGAWWTVAPDQLAEGQNACAVGPYRDYHDVAAKLLGKVVGIFQPLATEEV